MKSFSSLAAICCSFIVLCTLSACERTYGGDDSPPIIDYKPCNCLPAITTTGEGTFGCKVNGKIWVSLGGQGNMPETWEYFNGKASIHSYNADDQTFLNLAVGVLNDTGKYFFSSTVLGTKWASFGNPTKSYNADTIYAGYFHLLRLDLDKGIISGTFEMDLYDKYHLHGDDTLHITEGRFDIHM